MFQLLITTDELGTDVSSLGSYVLICQHCSARWWPLLLRIVGRSFCTRFINKPFLFIYIIIWCVRLNAKLKKKKTIYFWWTAWWWKYYGGMPPPQVWKEMIFGYLFNKTLYIFFQGHRSRARWWQQNKEIDYKLWGLEPMDGNAFWFVLMMVIHCWHTGMKRVLCC